MTNDPNRPPENIPLDDVPEPEWPPKEWKDAERAEERDPDRGQHFVWVLFAAIIIIVAWWGL